ncbi:serine protease [Streptomyces sp. ICBB 8177]|nr:serine protease [Streptomyces sp. ICBB 8177]
MPAWDGPPSAADEPLCARPISSSVHPAYPVYASPVGVVISGRHHTLAKRARIATVAVTSLTLATGSLLLAVPSQAATPAPGAKTVTGSHPAWATPAADAGAASAATQYTGTVYLAGQDPAGLAAYAKAVSQPGSASYGKFLTPAQYQARYGATKAQVAAVRKWLTGAGLTITQATDHALTVKGANSALKKAFGAGIDQYRVKGSLLHAPTRDVTVPAAVSSAVLGVVGLASPAAAHATPDSVPVTPATAGTTAKPADGLPTTATCSDYWGQKTATGAPNGYVNKAVPFDQCSFVPSQLRKAYGISGTGLTGKGVKVAIVDAYASPTMLADANKFATNHGDKAFRSGQYTEVVTPSQWNSQSACGDWSSEESLDVDMVHGLAPDADVVYVGANSCNDPDLLGALSTIVDKHLADVVTDSWGEIMHTTDAGDMTQAQIQAYEQVFEQGAVEGIGFNFSAGDCGDDSPTAAATGVNCQADTSRAQDQYPSSDPWVTSVGGTALGLASKSGSYGFETDMGTLRSALSSDGKSWSPLPGNFYFGGGGGTSEDFTQPWYQVGTVPNSLSHTLMTGAKSKTAQRVTPDVAMNGDLYTSVLVGQTVNGVYSEGGYGGTSVASPEFAAVQADAIQAQHHAIGFADPEIYLRDHLGLFRDVIDQQAAHHRTPLSNVADFGVVNGTLAVRLVAFGQDTTLNAVRGYDDATGVGSPTGAYLRSFGW